MFSDSRYDWRPSISFNSISYIPMLWGFTPWVEYSHKTSLKHVNSSCSSIRTEFENNNARIDVFVNVKFGCSVKDVAFRVQENIKSSVESMTEYKVEAVNVHVVGVNFSEFERDFVS